MGKGCFTEENKSDLIHRAQKCRVHVVNLDKWCIDWISLHTVVLVEAGGKSTNLYNTLLGIGRHAKCHNVGKEIARNLFSASFLSDLRHSSAPLKRENYKHGRRQPASRGTNTIVHVASCATERTEA